MQVGVSATYSMAMRRGWTVFWSAWIVVGAALVVAGVSYGMIPLSLMGLVMLAAFVPMLILTLRRFADRRPVIVIDAAGYHDRRLGAPIPWDKITELRRQQSGNRLFLQIGVADPGRYLGNAGILKRPMLAVNPRLGFPALASNLSGLDVAQVALATAADDWWAAR